MLVLTILDGWGHSEKREGNAILAANTPFIDSLDAHEAKTLVEASGPDVGLSKGQMGNSEVGHLNIGSGRVVFQNLPKISNAIKDGSFFKNKGLLKAMEVAKKSGTSLHLIGLLSDGGVHSHIDHIHALLDMAKANGVGKNLFLHMLLDGRDTPPRSAEKYIKQLESKLKGNDGEIATLMGRFYGMDRDNRWDRVELAYNAFVHGKGIAEQSAGLAIKNSYEKGINDEFVKPHILTEQDGEGNNRGVIKSGDSIIFLNFRADRMRQLVHSFYDKDFSNFDRGEPLKNLTMLCMTEYESSLPLPVAFSSANISNTLAEFLSNKGKKQFHTAETEKYAHVTFFFNGGKEAPVSGEERELIPSPQVTTYDLQPEMSALEVTETVIKEIRSANHDFIVVNLANPDMVGHTGIFDAAIQAVETIDGCVQRIVKEVRDAGGTILITADHGNIEKMLEDDGSVCTAHSTNPVPFYCLSGKKVHLRSGGKLADIAPTILHLMNIEKPTEMTGEPLIVDANER